MDLSSTRISIFGGWRWRGRKPLVCIYISLTGKYLIKVYFLYSQKQYSRATDRIILNDMKVLCQLYEKGCEWFGSIADFQVCILHLFDFQNQNPNGTFVCLGNKLTQFNITILNCFQINFISFSITWTINVCFVQSHVASLDATSDLNEGFKLTTKVLVNKKKWIVNIVVTSSRFLMNRCVIMSYHVSGILRNDIAG